jgi:hypothetical protein
MDVLGVSISTASIMDVQGVSIFLRQQYGRLRAGCNPAESRIVQHQVSPVPE